LGRGNFNKGNIKGSSCIDGQLLSHTPKLLCRAPSNY
jgi:hypothetical protein